MNWRYMLAEDRERAPRKMIQIQSVKDAVELDPKCPRCDAPTTIRMTICDSEVLCLQCLVEEYGRSHHSLISWLVGKPRKGKDTW